MTFDQLKNQGSNIYLACLAAFICLMTIKLSYFVPTVMSMGQIYFLVKCLALLISCKFIFLDDLSIKAKLLTVTAIIIFYFLAKISQDSNVFYYAILIVGAFDVDFDKILKTYIFTVVITILYIIFACWTKIIPEQIVPRAGQFHFLRLSLGFLTPTDLAARCFYLLTAYCAWRKLSLIKWEKIGALLFTILVFSLTNSRLDLIMMLLLLLIVIKPDFFKQLLDRLQFRGLAILTALYVFLNVALAYFFNPHLAWFRVLDHLLSSRLTFGNIALRQHGVSLFGQYVAEHSNGDLVPPTNYFYVDSSYIRLLVISGIVISLIVTIVIFYLLWRLNDSHSTSLLFFLLLALLSSAIDQHLVEVSYNIVLLATVAKVRPDNYNFNSIRFY